MLLYWTIVITLTLLIVSLSAYFSLPPSYAESKIQVTKAQIIVWALFVLLGGFVGSFSLGNEVEGYVLTLKNYRNNKSPTVFETKHGEIIFSSWAGVDVAQTNTFNLRKIKLYNGLIVYTMELVVCDGVSSREYFITKDQYKDLVKNDFKIL